MNDSKIIDLFLKLTSKTYPFGTEHLLEKMLPKGTKRDIYGNYYFKIGKNPRVIFASHLDTVSGSYTDVKHVFKESGQIVTTDGTTTLGADCKAGVTIMLNMIQQGVNGLYYFFVGEEVGCVGSNRVANNIEIFNSKNYDKVISFDRRGNESIITYQSKIRSCSDEFANAFIAEVQKKGMEMKFDTKGVRTDSFEFMKTIPECTNISVGYDKEHTFTESQDLEFLTKITNVACDIDWEKLPTKRNNLIEEKLPIEYTNNTHGSNGVSRNENGYVCRSGLYDDSLYGEEGMESIGNLVKRSSILNRNRNIPPIHSPHYDPLNMEHEDDEYDEDDDIRILENLEKDKENNPSDDTKFLAHRDFYINISFSLEEIKYIKDNLLFPEDSKEDENLLQSFNFLEQIKRENTY